MKGALAAILRSLVLPAGATSGTRIVLDGVNGIISVYDANDDLRVQIGGSIALQEFLQLSTGDPAEFTRADLTPVIGGAGGTRQLELLLGPPSFAGGDRAVILMRSASQDATVGSSISYLAPLHDFDTGGSGAAPDITLAGVSLPRGIMADPVFTNATASAASAGTEQKDTDLGDYTFTALAGRLYIVHCTGRIGSSVAADQADLRIRDGDAGSPTTASTLLTARSYQIGNATGGQAVDLHHQRGNFSPGVHKLAAFYIRTAGTGNVTFRQSTGEFRDLWVEDIGPAPR